MGDKDRIGINVVESLKAYAEREEAIAKIQCLRVKSRFLVVSFGFDFFMSPAKSL